MAKQARVNSCVLADHAQYIDLVLLTKWSDVDSFKLEASTVERKGIEVGKVTYTYINTETGYLQCCQHKTNTTHYNFQLFAKSFMEEPIFRFETTGPSHTNPKNYSPLIEHNVKTPGSHCPNLPALQQSPSTAVPMKIITRDWFQASV